MLTRVGAMKCFTDKGDRRLKEVSDNGCFVGGVVSRLRQAILPLERSTSKVSFRLKPESVDYGAEQNAFVEVFVF